MKVEVVFEYSSKKPKANKEFRCNRGAYLIKYMMKNLKKFGRQVEIKYEIIILTILGIIQ